MGIMYTIGEAIDGVREWACAETKPGKMLLKAFVAGWVDGWEYGCLIVGNVVCAIGLIGSIVRIFSKNKDEEEI